MISVGCTSAATSGEDCQTSLRKRPGGAYGLIRRRPSYVCGRGPGSVAEEAQMHLVRIIRHPALVQGAASVQYTWKTCDKKFG